MQSSQTAGHAAEQFRQRWLQACRARGTPAPDPAQVARFLASLPEEAQAALEQALLLCLNGREKHGELAILSWAAACTRPAFVAQLQAHGLACAGHDLFAAGLSLMAQGWDMSARVAQLVSNPQDIDALGAMLAVQAPARRAEADKTQEVQVPAIAPAWPEQASSPSSQPEPPEWPQPPDPAWEDSMKRPSPFRVVHALETTPAPAGQEPPTFDAQHPEQVHDAAIVNRQDRLQLRLFGREAAHTLEIGPHRRGGSFMGVHVVTVESARALGSGGYDWGRKLTVQLTPEEMPTAMAVLMNLAPAARFGQHGVERDKFVELRRQEGGLVVVTGQGGSVYAVPVKTATVYYLLGLLARAMAQGLPGASLAEVLALVKASQSSG